MQENETVVTDEKLEEATVSVEVKKAGRKAGTGKTGERKANGQGSYFDDKSRGRLGWRIRKVVDGHTKTVTLYGKTKTELEKKVREYRKSCNVQKTEVVKTDGVTVEEWTNKWLEARRNKVKYRTYLYYKGFVDHYINPLLGKLKITELKVVHIDDMLEELKNGVGISKEPLSKSSMNGIRATIRACLSYAVKCEVVATNVAMSSDAIKNGKTREVVVPSEEQVKALLELADKGSYSYTTTKSKFQISDSRDFLIKCYAELLFFAINTGARYAECVGVQWSDVDFENGTVFLQRQIPLRKDKDAGKVYDTLKDNQKRLIKISSKVLERLKAWKVVQDKFAEKFSGAFNNTDCLVFCNSTGNPIVDSDFRREFWYKIKAKAKITGVTFHCLRHYHASMLLQAGVHISDVSKRLGHCTVDFTYKTYIHVIEKINLAEDDKLANALDKLA